MSAPAVVVRPITDDDTQAVSAFLHEHLNPRVSVRAWSGLLSPPWPADAPNHGFLLASGENVVGVYIALYSQRTIAGTPYRFCNLAAFCVLEDFRSHGLRLVRALLAQKGYEFTDFSPSGNVVALNERLGFSRLDPASHLSVNLPLPGGRGVRVTDRRNEIENLLSGELLQLYRDHRDGAARHAVLHSGARVCYLVFRKERRKGLPLFASILYAGGDVELLDEGWAAVRRLLVLRHGLPLTLAEARVVVRRPPLSFRVTGRPRMFRSRNLEAADIDHLYSELTCLEW